MPGRWSLPLLAWEAFVRAHRRSTYIQRTLIALVVLAILWMRHTALAPAAMADPRAWGWRAEAGEELLLNICGVATYAMLLVLPMRAANAFGLVHRRGLEDALVFQDRSPLRLVVEIWSVQVLLAVTLLLVILPGFGVCYASGGVTAQTTLHMGAAVTLSALQVAAAAVAWSAWTPRALAIAGTWISVVVGQWLIEPLSHLVPPHQVACQLIQACNPWELEFAGDLDAGQAIVDGVCPLVPVLVALAVAALGCSRRRRQAPRQAVARSETLPPGADAAAAVRWLLAPTTLELRWRWSLWMIVGALGTFIALIPAVRVGALVGLLGLGMLRVAVVTSGILSGEREGGRLTLLRLLPRGERRLTTAVDRLTARYRWWWWSCAAIPVAVLAWQTDTTHGVWLLVTTWCLLEQTRCAALVASVASATRGGALLGVAWWLIILNLVQAAVWLGCIIVGYVFVLQDQDAFEGWSLAASVPAAFAAALSPNGIEATPWTLPIHVGVVTATRLLVWAAVRQALSPLAPAGAARLLVSKPPGLPSEA